MWASGDFAVIGTTLQIVGELLCEAVDIRSTERVLDVAAGNGNATLAAARRFANVTSTDYVPALLERGRGRARAEGLEVDVRDRRRRGAALSGRELRRRAVDLRRDVRARSRQVRCRDAARVPARRPHRSGVLDAAGFPRRPLSNGRQARAADARRALAAAVGNRRSSQRPVRERRRSIAHTHSHTSRSAIDRRSTSSTYSGRSMDRPTRRSLRSTRTARPRSRPTCSRCCGHAIAAARPVSSCQRSISRRWSCGDNGD